MPRARKQFLTEAELMALGSDARVEVIDGAVIDLPGCGVLHHEVAGNIYDSITGYCHEHKWGRAFMHGLLFVLDKHDEIVMSARVPDVAFLSKEQLHSRTWDIESFPRVAPLLAVEVVSHEDSAEATRWKVRDYLDAGSQQVWVVDPAANKVHQHIRGDTTVRNYLSDDVIDADEIFPGLRLTLADIFALPEWE